MARFQRSAPEGRSGFDLRRKRYDLYRWHRMLWKLRWFGLGASYVWGGNFNGWTAGLDLSFKL